MKKRNKENGRFEEAGGSAKYKYIHILSGREEGNGWSIRITINNEGKISFPYIATDKKEDARHRAMFYKATKSMGFCFGCGELDFRVLGEHHIFGKKVDPITITLCANCHARLHWKLGTTNFYKER